MAVDGNDCSVLGSDHGDLHLHSFDDHDRVAFLDSLSYGCLDLEYLSGCAGFYSVLACAACGSSCLCGRCSLRSRFRSSLGGSGSCDSAVLKAVPLTVMI